MSYRDLNFVNKDFNGPNICAEQSNTNWGMLLTDISTHEEHFCLVTNINTAVGKNINTDEWYKIIANMITCARKFAKKHVLPKA